MLNTNYLVLLKAQLGEPFLEILIIFFSFVFFSSFFASFFGKTGT